MNKRTAKIIGIVIGILTVLLMIVYFFVLDAFLENLVKSKLNSYINNTPGRVYDISYRNLDISVSNRAVRIGGLNILPRKHAVDSMKNNKLSMLISVKVDSFYFEGLKLFKLLVLNKVEFEEIIADRPEITYYFNPKGKIPPQKAKLTSNVLTDKLKHASVRHIKVENGTYYAIKLPVRDSIYFKLDSSTLIADNVIIEPAHENPFRKVYFDSMLMVSKNFYGGFVKNYKIEADEMELSTKREMLKLTNLTFVPKHFNMADTSVQFSHDIFLVKVKELLFNGMNFKGDYQNTDYFIRKVSIAKPDFTVSTDKRLPKNMNRKPMLAELIRNIPINLIVDSLQVKDGKILYHEVTSGKKPPLNVLFAKVNLMGLNITNDQGILKQNPDMVIDMQSKFLNAGLLKVNIKIPVQSPDNKMIVSGTLGPMSFRPVTKMLEGPMGVRFTSGKINSLDFHFVADTSHSTGKLNLDYSDMKIQIFSGGGTTIENKKEKNKWLLNAIVNGIIKTNNHKEDINFAGGLIDYERPDDIAIPGYLYRSLKTGLLSTFKPGKRHADEAVARQKAQAEQKKEVKKEQKEVVKEQKSNKKSEGKEALKEKRKKKKDQKSSEKESKQNND